MRFISKCVVALALGALLIGTAQADTLTDNECVVLPNDTDVTIYLDQFDPSLGTLTNVYVNVRVQLDSARVQLDNDASVAQGGTALVLNVANSLTSSVSLVKTGLADSINASDLTINEGQVFNLSATTGDTVGEFNVTNNTDYALWEPGFIIAGDSGNITSSAWAGYTGTGQFSITLNSTYLTSATFEGSNGFFEGNTPCGGFAADVCYTYTTVPEPGTLALLAGLFGLLVIARKRRS